MSGNSSLKMGLTFAASLNMGKNLCWVLYMITYEKGEYELQLNQHKLYPKKIKI